MDLIFLELSISIIQRNYTILVNCNSVSQKFSDNRQPLKPDYFLINYDPLRPNVALTSKRHLRRQSDCCSSTLTLTLLTARG